MKKMTKMLLAFIMVMTVSVGCGDLKDQIADLEKKVGSLQSQLDSKNSEISGLQNQINQKTAQLAEVQKKLDASVSLERAQEMSNEIIRLMKELDNLYAQLDDANQRANNLLQQYWVANIFSDELYINGGNPLVRSFGEPFMAIGLALFGDMADEVMNVELTEVTLIYYDSELKGHELPVNTQEFSFHKHTSFSSTEVYDSGSLFVFRSNVPSKLLEQGSWHYDFSWANPHIFFRVKYILKNGQTIQSVLLHSKPSMFDGFWNGHRDQFFRVNTQENALVGESLLPFQGEMDRFWSPWMDAFKE